MRALLKHVTSSVVAGIVAILPIGGTVLAVVYFESVLRAAWDGIGPLRPYYFPGLGLLAAAVVIYLVGLVVSTFLGRWLWSIVDRILDHLPLLGHLYKTLKQILGYGEGEDALFDRVVLVRSREAEAEEIGLVTNSVAAEGGDRIVVFVPASPNPMTGRLLVVDPAAVRDAGMSVHDALTALVAVGKTEIPPCPTTERAPSS